MSTIRRYNLQIQLLRAYLFLKNHIYKIMDPIKEALTFANKVAGISTTKQGAAASMPSLEDLKNY